MTIEKRIFATHDNVDNERSIERSDTILDRETIEIIEQGHIPSQQKVELLLLLNHQKKITHIHARSGTWHNERERSLTHIDEAELIEMRRVAEQLGLQVEAYRTVQTISAGVNIHYDDIELIVSDSRNVINQYIEAINHKDDRTKGLIFGYPRTAIDAYQKKVEGDDSHLIPLGQYPHEWKTEDWFAFVTFRLSKEHVTEELKTVHKWAETVKKNSPAIFQEYVLSRTK